MRESPSEAWARCRPHIEAALEHSGDTHAIEDVEAGIEAGIYHFWPGQACAVVTEFWDRPRIKILNFWLLGGNLRELRAMREHIEEWATQNGCRRALGGGRPEWARVLKTSGYSPRWTIVSKELP